MTVRADHKKFSDAIVEHRRVGCALLKRENYTAEQINAMSDDEWRAAMAARRKKLRAAAAEREKLVVNGKQAIEPGKDAPLDVPPEIINAVDGLDKNSSPARIDLALYKIAERPDDEQTTALLQRVAARIGRKWTGKVERDLRRGLKTQRQAHDQGWYITKDARDNLTARLESFNERYAVCRIGAGAMVASIPTNTGEQITFLKTASLHELYAPEMIMRVNGKAKSVSRIWWDWRDRRTYHRAPVFCPDGHKHPPGVLNLWRGWAIHAKPGDWSLMRAHIFHVICRGNPLWFAYLMSWIANIYQHPGVKPGVAFNLSGKKGTGKSKVPEWLRKIMPANSRSFSRGEQVFGKHNSGIEQCLLAVLEEAFWGGDKQAEGRIKDLITSSTQIIEPKFVDAFEVDNFTRLWLNTNDPWSFPASGDERRLFALEASEAHRRDIPYFKAIDAQMSNGGLEAMLFDLMHLMQPDWIELRLPPDTPWLVRQIEYSLSSELAWLRSVLTDGMIVPADRLSKPCAWPDVSPDVSAEDDAVTTVEKKFSALLKIEGFEQHYTGEIDVPCDVVRDAFRKFATDLKRGGIYVTPEQLGKFLSRFGVKRARPRIGKDRIWAYRFPRLDELRKTFAAETKIGCEHDGADVSPEVYATMDTEGIDAVELTRWRLYGEGGSAADVLRSKGEPV